MGKKNRRFSFLIFFIFSWYIWGCGQWSVKDGEGPIAPLDKRGHIKSKEYYEITVNYGTTRVDMCVQEKAGNCESLKRYETGNDRTVPYIKYGHVIVRIPFNKKIGETKGMLIKKISADLGWHKFKKNISAGDILIYVHGYNTTFNAAAVRCAQLAFDLNYKGVPVFFSWPSKGNVLGTIEYGTDKDRAVENFTHLADFLINIAESTDKKIHIVSHSMGAYILTHSLAIISKEMNNNKLLLERKTKNEDKVFNQIVFAAPDIARDEFKRVFIESNFTNISHGYTLYSIKNDFVCAFR